MANLKITEVQTSNSLDGAHLLVTRPEPDGEGGTVESLRRVDAGLVANQEYVDAAIAELRADLTYKAISGTVSISPNVAEWGSEVTPVVSWSLSKTPARLTVGEIVIDPPTASGQFAASEAVSTPGGVTVTATDERGAVLRQNVSVAFADRVYYGGLAGEVTEDKVKAMASKVQASPAGNWTITLRDGDVVCFATTNSGERGFAIGANDYELTRQTVEITNAFGVTKTYYVYRTGNPLPAGSLTLTVR